MNNEQNAHEPLVDKALVGFDLAAEHHLAGCEPCQGERDRMQEALREFAAANREHANRPESFWQQQALCIERARQRSETRSRVKLALVPAVVVLLLAAFVILGRPTGVRPGATVKPAIQVDPDHELLLEVERVMQTDTPLALEPATLMVDERDSNWPLNSTSERKEVHSNEN